MQASRVTTPSSTWRRTDVALVPGCCLLKQIEARAIGHLTCRVILFDSAREFVLLITRVGSDPVLEGFGLDP
jgi:hypothetical protein